jgi:hypothetical protein
MRPGLILSPQSRGPLWVWKDPEPGHYYSIGVDTSSGSAGSDPSVAQVVENQTCEQVAEFYGHPDPNRFGALVALLGWHYNEAFLGIETHPSPHGLTAFIAAEKVGYTNFYSQTRPESPDFQMIHRKGWYTSVGTPNLLLDRVREALAGGSEIHSERLVKELRALRFGDTGDKLEKKQKNDLFMAYGIALKVRDTTVTFGIGKRAQQPRVVRPFEEAFWDAFDPEAPKQDKPIRRSLDVLYDGV